MKAIIPLLYTCIAFFSVAPQAQALGFSDIPTSHSNYESIEYVQSQKIVEGYADGTYKPDSTINRAEFTKIIIAAIASEQEIRNCNLSTIEYLSDIDIDAWYAPYVCVGKARGIITGHLPTSGEPYFAPSEKINTIGAAKIVTSGLEIGEPPLDCLVDWGRNCIQAAQRGEKWYDRHIHALAAKNAIPLSVNTLQYHYITRGEMAEIIYRLKANATGKPSRTYDELTYSAGWYVSHYLEYEIAWTTGWSIFHKNEDHVSFGKIQNFSGHGYDGEFFVFAFDAGVNSSVIGDTASVDGIANSMGSQFKDRIETREQISLNGVPATLVQVTTSSAPSWEYVSVIIENDDRIYWIHNGAIPNELFYEFIQTFRLL